MPHAVHEAETGSPAFTKIPVDQSRSWDQLEEISYKAETRTGIRTSNNAFKIGKKGIVISKLNEPSGTLSSNSDDFLKHKETKQPNKNSSRFFK